MPSLKGITGLFGEQKNRSSRGLPSPPFRQTFYPATPNPQPHPTPQVVTITIIGAYEIA